MCVEGGEGKGWRGQYEQHYCTGRQTNTHTLPHPHTLTMFLKPAGETCNELEWMALLIALRFAVKENWPMALGTLEGTRKLVRSTSFRLLDSVESVWPTANSP